MKFFQKIKTFFNTFKEQREIKKEQRRNKRYARKAIKIERKQNKLIKKTPNASGSFKVKKPKDRGYTEGGWLQKRLKQPTKLLETWYARNKDFKAAGFIGNKKINKKTIDKMNHEWNMKHNEFYRQGYEWGKRQAQLIKNDKEKWARWENWNKKKWEKKLKKDIDFLDKAIEGNTPKKEKKAPKSRSEKREAKRQYNRKYNSEYYDKNKDKHKLHYAHTKYKDNQKEEIEYLKRTIEKQDEEIKKLTTRIEKTNEKLEENKAREAEYKNQILNFEKQIDDLKNLIESLRDHINEEQKEEEDYLPDEPQQDNGWDRDRDDSKDQMTEEEIDECLEDLYKEFHEDEMMDRILGNDDNFDRLFDIGGESISNIVDDIIKDSPLYDHYSIDEIKEMLIDKYS
ncbi:MAG: hypothetical protein IKJ03_02970 [Mycoplasmataceae bacterium]|nr:hypothetical protein [Mycoplasmataceae bacterium]